MTAMDAWLLMCMLFVALATFEYAILLAMRFGNHLISASEKSKDAFRRCVIVVVYSDSRPRAMTEIMHDTIRDRPEGPLNTLSINA